MRPGSPGVLGCALVAAGCTAEAPTGPAVDREAQVRACAAVVADHVGLPVGAVDASAPQAAAGGTAVVEVRDGDRLHTCEVDASARVLAIRHPGAE